MTNALADDLRGWLVEPDFSSTQREPLMLESSRGQRQVLLDDEIPALASEAVEQPGAAKYDAILVDEGQDLRPHWWSALRKALVPGGEMMLVADATQDVYGTAKAWTDEVMQGAGFRGGWAQLDVSYRLPPTALEMARDFAQRFLPAETAQLPEPEYPEVSLPRGVDEATVRGELLDGLHRLYPELRGARVLRERFLMQQRSPLRAPPEALQPGFVAGLLRLLREAVVEQLGDEEHRWKTVFRFAELEMLGLF
jgi:hypothetical protein